jgi:hypothetical protein
MDRSTQLRHLREAEQHIARGVQHISQQASRIADFDACGHDSTLARSILETFLITQALHIAHRDLIVSELGL